MNLLKHHLETVVRGTECQNVTECPVCHGPLPEKPHVDLQRNVLLVADRQIDLWPRDAEILHVLISAMPRLISSIFLQQEVWGLYKESCDYIYGIYLNRLRRHILDTGLKVEVSRGVGMRLAWDFAEGCAGCGRRLPDGLHIDYNGNRIMLDGQEIRFTETEMMLLVGMLCAAPERIESDELYCRAYGRSDDAAKNRASVVIWKIRQKLSGARLSIDTKQWHGYRAVLETKQ